MNRELTPNLAAGASTYSQNWSWPDSPTAILVIHGMGQQDPFDTLDQFASTLIPVMEEEGGGLTISKRHLLLGRDTWNENYISLVSDGEQPIDIYEYYWAHETQREITGSEVFQWLVQVGLLARKYYEKNLALAEEYEEAGSEAFGKRFLLRGRRAFKKYWYLKYAGLLLRLTQGALALADPVLGHFLPGASKPLKIIGGVVGRFIGDKVADSFGDVVLYTTTDLKSRRYEVRRRILQGCVEKVRQLLLRTPPEYYGRIVLVGHSLGSVIAYDTINRINHEMNAGGVISQGMARRLKGLVTFGSPLDKIAFFLRSRAGEDQHIKRQIQANFHSFRAKDWNPGSNPPPDLALVSGIKHHLDGMVWLNFWDPKDPIGGPLDFYLVDYALAAARKKVDPRLKTSKGLPVFQGNRELVTGESTPWGAHTGYWKNREMYRKILREVII
jgi:hypothetical protein